jgi:hypothetical protein
VHILNAINDFFQVVWAFASHTPWWVYLLFIYLMIIGVKALKTQIKPFSITLIMPVVFTIMSIESILALQHLNPLYEFLIFTLSLLLVGGSLGYFLALQQNVQIDKEHKLIKLPGSAFTLISVLLIFAVKYYFSYRLKLTPNDHQLEYYFIGASGIITGLFAGRTACYYRQLLRGPWVNLAPPKEKNTSS